VIELIDCNWKNEKNQTPKLSTCHWTNRLQLKEWKNQTPKLSTWHNLGGSINSIKGISEHFFYSYNWFSISISILFFKLISRLYCKIQTYKGLDLKRCSHSRTNLTLSAVTDVILGMTKVFYLYVTLRKADKSVILGVCVCIYICVCVYIYTLILLIFRCRSCEVGL
jgi:hypothetical protein